jgi:hypothetical protein
VDRNTCDLVTWSVIQLDEMAAVNRVALAIGLGLAAPFAVAWAQEPPPSADEQERLLQSMGSYAEQYIARLPNFICEQVTRQYQAGKKPKSWRKGDTLTFRLLFSGGKEQRNLELVNEKPIRIGMRRWRAPLSTQGEFGILLANIFASESDATFVWRGWQDLRGRRVAVFDYAIDQAHSTLKLSLVDLAEAVIPYHGSVYGDPQTGAIWRIEDAADDLPKAVDTNSISTTIDYDDVPIGSKQYLLPSHASILATTDASNIRNELEFRNYQKFETDSVIKYASVEGNSGASAPAEH